MQWVWDHSQSKHGARLVLLAIADCIREDGGAAWPSVPELARKTALKERAVRAAITELGTLGELVVEYNAGPKGCNRYRIVTTPAKNAGVQSLQGVDAAPLQTLHPQPESEFEQVNGQDPANFAPPAKNAPLQKTTLTPANFAPGTVRNRNSSSSSKKNVARDDVERVCTHLADRIEANDSKRPSITEKWRTEARLLIDNDHRTEEQIHKAIDWCQDSSFWHSRIMSMPKLRDKYDTLRLQADDERRKRSSGGMRGGGASDDLSGEEYGKGKTRI